MIKLTTKGRYGTRLMLNLALHYTSKKQPIILKNVSKEEEISLRYLEQIIIPLRINKLIKSTRGAGGGYSLSRHPSEIKLLEIIEAVEGSISLVDCVEDHDYCTQIPLCATYEIWKKARFILRDYFEQTTLQDLVEISKFKIKKSRKKEIR